MNQEKIQLLHSIILERWQFPQQHDGKVSELHRDIQIVLKCSGDEAIQYASTFCNFISFYATTFSAGYHSMAFTEFFKESLNNKITDKTGYLFFTKKQIADYFGWESKEPVYISDYKNLVNPIRLDPEKFYQIKMKADTHGFHFLAAYIDNGKFFIDDTSYRGIGTEATKYINKNNFVWVSEV